MREVYWFPFIICIGVMMSDLVYRVIPKTSPKVKTYSGTTTACGSPWTDSSAAAKPLNEIRSSESHKAM